MSQRPSFTRRRKVAMIVFPGVQILDVTGPCEVLAGAADFTKAAPYVIELIAARRGPVKSSCGLTVNADRAFADLSPARRRGYDTLLVAGGAGTASAVADAELVAFVGDVARHARRVASVCTGAFVLAEAGLLSRRRAATHWSACEQLAAAYPDVQVDADAIYVRDGNIWTSAGVTAGMDLALALVVEDLGREVALAVARQKVVYMIRPGGQSQFSAQLAAQSVPDDRFSELGRWICEHVGGDLTVPSLAGRVHMSQRNFARRFTRAMGRTPARFVEAARIDAARRALLEPRLAIDVVAANCGFGSAERMRRAFHRHLGVSPQDYRARFAA